MLLQMIMGMVLAADRPSAGDCPRQPEPPALASAAFGVPASGDTLLFSYAPSFQSIRYALRVVKPTGATTASASLVRLKLRFDCNVHDRTAVWNFELSTDETESLFATAVALEQLDQNRSEIVLDGTIVELERYASGQKAFTYSSNGLAKDQLSSVVLNILKLHIPVSDLPRSADWRYRLPGSSL